MPALFLIAPISSMALGTGNLSLLTDVHYLVPDASVPSPSTCGTITDLHLDVTLHGGSTTFGVNGYGSCTGTQVPLILTGSGVLVQGTTANFDLYFGDTRMNCVVTLPPATGGCHIYMLADLSVVATLNIDFTSAQ
jgi:hypothetical protein